MVLTSAHHFCRLFVCYIPIWRLHQKLNFLSTLLVAISFLYPIFSILFICICLFILLYLFPCFQVIEIETIVIYKLILIKHFEVYISFSLKLSNQLISELKISLSWLLNTWLKLVLCKNCNINELITFANLEYFHFYVSQTNFVQ